MERKSRAFAESSMFITLVVVALVMVNFLSVRLFVRRDLTRRQLYSLSSGTTNVLDHLRDQLTIRVFFTPNQPPPANDDERFLRDQLEEYRAHGHGRIRVQYIATDNDARKREASELGCTENTLQAVNAQEDQATLQRVYRCVVFEYLGRREKIEFLPPGTTGLEYEISSIIKNISAPESERNRAIGFLGGHGELTPEEGLQYLEQLMTQERVPYRTRTVNLNNGENEVPADIKGLIIANPTRQISERELRRLDAYLMRGGGIAIFAGGLTFSSTDPTSANGTAAEHHLNDWLERYGLRIEGDAVLDPRSTDGVVRMGRQAGRVRLVTWPVIAATSAQPSESDMLSNGGLDPSFTSVFRLSEVITPYPSSLTVLDANRRTAGGTLRVFARTGPRAIRRTSDFDLNVIEILQQGRQLFENASAHGPYVVGAALQGPFASAYAGRAPTPASGDGGTGDASAPSLSAAEQNVAERSTNQARLMVVSSGNVFALEPLRIMAQLSGGRPGNLTFLFNTFDFLSQDTDLLAVRAKDTSDPQIRADVTQGRKNLFKWGCIVGLPLTIGIVGVALLSARRRRRAGRAAEFR